VNAYEPLDPNDPMGTRNRLDALEYEQRKGEALVRETELERVRAALDEAEDLQERFDRGAPYEGTRERSIPGRVAALLDAVNAPQCASCRGAADDLVRRSLLHGHLMV